MAQKFDLSIHFLDERKDLYLCADVFCPAASIHSRQPC